MGFIRDQQIRFAVGLLRRQYQKQGGPTPAERDLHQQAARVVDQAHDIAKQRGHNLMTIVKELVADIRRR